MDTDNPTPDVAKLESIENSYQQLFNDAKSEQSSSDTAETVPNAATNAIIMLERDGFVPPDAARARAILATTDAFNMPSQDLAAAFGIDYSNLDTMSKIRTSEGARELIAAIGERFKDWASGNEAAIMFELANIEAPGNQSEAETVRALAAVEQIRRDPMATFDQGYSVNVLISEQSSYVLKVPRNNPDSLKAHASALAAYVSVRAVIGDEFLPHQMILHAKAQGQDVVLQEKLGDDWQTLASNDQLTAALAQPKNRDTVVRFLDGASKLYEEHGQMVDLVGDNLRYTLDNGALKIKLLDYGVFKRDNIRYGDGPRIDQSTGQLNQLLQLVASAQ